MKRSRKQNSKKARKNTRKRTRESRSLAYDSLEARQMLAFSTGIDLVGAALADGDINSLVPNPEGDVGPNHFVEIGEQTFTVYDRDGVIVEATNLNQFFIDAGGELFGEDLQSPRVIYDRLAERWFAIAVGNGEGVFAGNRIHIAFSDTSDPSGQWQQLDFVADITGVKVHDNPTLAVDADGVYFSTQNFENGVLEDVAIYSIPKADLFLANPTLANISQFTDLSVFDYGISIQFASNFDASDGTVFGFSVESQDVNGSGNASESELNPSNINTFEIQGAAGANPTLTDPNSVSVGVFAAPRPINQIDASGTSSTLIEIEGGLTHSLVEHEGSVFAAQTVGIQFLEGVQDNRSNSINWFQLLVTPGETPVLASSPIHNNVTRVFNAPVVDVGNNIPDPPEFDMDPMVETNEFAGITYFNPAIAVSDSGIVAVTFNRVSSFDLFGVTTPPASPVFNVQGIETMISLGLPVNGGQGIDMDGNPFFPRAGLQFESPVILQPSEASDSFAPTGGSQWGAYSSLRSDPVDPLGFFSVVPFQEEVNDEWAVAITQILPVDFQPYVPATPNADEIIVRVDPNDSDFVEVEINDVVTDRFAQSLIRRLVVGGLAGADSVTVDYSNGDPTPSPTLTTSGPGGLFLLGDGGTDSIHSLTGENVDFVLDNSISGPFSFPLFFMVESSFGGNTNGSFTLVTQNGMDLPVEDQTAMVFQDFETVIGGSGDDTFLFVAGTLEGNAEGGDGDDRFIFRGDTRIDGSANGGAGFNTLDLLQRTAPTEIVLFSIGQTQGFNGRTIDGPIGQFNDVLDQFRDFSLVLGAEADGESIQALNQFEATYTLTIPNVDDSLRTPHDTPDFVASSIEQGGAKMYFTEFETLIGSVVDDVFNVQSNDEMQMPNVRLEGRQGDDTFNFSSDAPANFGQLGMIDGLFAVNGGTGANALVTSDFGRLGPEEILVLSARLSGPIEVIYTTEDTGTFDVTINGSDGTARDQFILQSFLSTNTLNVFGHGGNDEFIIQDLSQAVVELFGGEGDDEYIIEQVNGVDDRNVTINDSVDAERDVALIAGTILNEVFIVDLDSFESEQFTFIGVEEFGFDGRGGNDEFYVRAISADFPIQLRGGDGNDRFHISSDAPTNLGDLTTMNNDLSIDAGAGINRILISNESGEPLDVEIFSSVITGLFANGDLTYEASDDGVFGIVDEDGNLDMENFGGIDITGSNGGADRFQISGFLPQNSLKIDGRLGADEFIVGNTGSPGAIGGVVVLDGASDGDTYTVFLENLLGDIVQIDDTGFSGDDVLQAKGSSLDDNISLTQTMVSTADGSMAIDDFFEHVIIEGLGGNDIITMTNSPADMVTLSGNEGDDQIIVNGTVGAETLTIFTSDGDDSIVLNESSLLTTITAFGGAGIDSFFVGANVRGDVILDGQLGVDSYTIELTDIDTRDVQIVDMGGASDVIVVGTSDSDEFLINNAGVTSGGQTIGLPNLASLGVQGRGGNDTFNITETMVDLILAGEDGADVFNISSDAPFMTGGTSDIHANIDIDGGTGNNQLRVTNVAGSASNIFIGSSLITGMTNGNEITYRSTDGQFARPDGTVGGIHIITSDSGNDVIEIGGLTVGDTLRVESRGGMDIFDVANAVEGDVLLDGGEDADTYNYQFGGSAVREVNIVDTGTMGVDELNLLGSDFADEITLTPTGISDGASTLNFNLPIDSILIQGLGGPDIFRINGAPTAHVILEGNDANDTFIINNTAGIDNIDLFAGLGNDTFQFNGSSDSTRIDAFGSGGNDTFVVTPGAFGKLFLDGEEGGDVHQISFAGEGSRRIDTRDSGLGGFDEVQVFGTQMDDRIALRTRLFLYDNESVVFDENTERTQAHGLLGNDRFVVFGSRSPDSRVFAGSGDDNFVMNSGSSATKIDLHGQNGNDTFLIRKTTVDTTTNLFGENGNDRFNIGSTANQDFGNLGLIRGELNIFGGSNVPGGEDVLYANDRAVNAAYSYMVTPSSITPIAGPANLPRANFAGINFNSSIEAVRLDGTDQANLFEVFASQTARYFIDGNSPTTDNADKLRLFNSPGDGSQSFITDADNGEGFATFENGNEIVQFEKIEDFEFMNG